MSTANTILLVMAGLSGATITWYGTQMICDKSGSGQNAQLLSACNKAPLKNKQTSAQRKKDCQNRFKGGNKGGFGNVMIGKVLKFGGCVFIIIAAILIGMMNSDGF
jgi:hypothetical protein